MYHILSARWQWSNRLHGFQQLHGPYNSPCQGRLSDTWELGHECSCHKFFTISLSFTEMKIEYSHIRNKKAQHKAQKTLKSKKAQKANLTANAGKDQHASLRLLLKNHRAPDIRRTRQEGASASLMKAAYHAQSRLESLFCQYLQRTMYHQ
jgi:hypothetical protein